MKNQRRSKTKTQKYKLFIKRRQLKAFKRSIRARYNKKITNYNTHAYRICHGRPKGEEKRLQIKNKILKMVFAAMNVKKSSLKYMKQKNM